MEDEMLYESSANDDCLFWSAMEIFIWPTGRGYTWVRKITVYFAKLKTVREKQNYISLCYPLAGNFTSLYRGQFTNDVVIFPNSILFQVTLGPFIRLVGHLYGYWLGHWRHNYCLPPALPDIILSNNPDSKVHGANMGPTWRQQDPSGPHVGSMNFAIRERSRFPQLPWHHGEGTISHG